MDRLYVLAAALRSGAGRPPTPTSSSGPRPPTSRTSTWRWLAPPPSRTPWSTPSRLGSVLDVGVINTSEVTIVAEARAVRGALQRIVGEAPGRRTKDWTRWWESEASAPYRPSSPPSEPDAKGAADR